MARVLQTDASLWKEEKTLSYSHKRLVWDSVWTGRLEDGSLPTYYIGEPTPEYASCTLILSTSASPSPPQENILHLSSLTETFPHLDPWTGTTDHAVILLASLLRYRRIYSETLTTDSVTREPPLPLYYITYRGEINCLPMLKAHPLIHKVIVLEPDSVTYADIFRTIQTLPPCLVAFGNPNVYLDTAWKDLWSIPMKGTLLALLACESKNQDDPDVQPISNSQDTWVIRSQDVPDPSSFDLPLGYLGSESTFAYRMLQNRFLVVNPARSLLTWKIPAPKTATMVKSPVYHYIHPTGINDMKPVLTCPTETIALRRTVEGPDATRWLHKMSKKGMAIPLGTSEYTLTTPKPLHLSYCFQTMSGLAFDVNAMYIGNAAGAQEAWSQPLYAMLPTRSYPSGSIVHMNCKRREDYVLHVLPKVVDSHVCPDEYVPIAKLFGRKTLPYIPDSYAVFKHATCAPVDYTITPAHIVTLREAVSWSPRIDPELSIVCTGSYPEALHRAWKVRILYPTDSIEVIIGKVTGAWGMVCTSDTYHWSWLLPEGARVFELSATSDAAHHLSTVAGLRHIFTREDKLLDSIADT